VTGTVSVTSTPTRTNTPTPSPTITLTPTPFPERFEKRLEPDIPIPDGTGDEVVSTLVVDSDVVIRELRVRPNITHPDIGDLEIYLIHPDDIRLLVHAEDEDRGEEDIRDYISITGSQLALIQGKSVRGEWTLEVTDTLEGEEGTLLEWFLQVFP
jgi:subtilisin-like proprotein convertase family protein